MHSEGIRCCRSTTAFMPCSPRSRSPAAALHRCLRRHGISRLPQVEGEASAKRKFKAYPIGYFHIDIAEVRTAQGKLYLLVAIDRTSKFAFVEMHEKVARRTAGDFLRRLIAAVPYKVHTVLTDNGTHFTTPGNTSSAAPDIKAALEAGELVWAHAFEYACAQNDIDHRLTKPKHPWTNGQVERMNRTIKDATVKRYFYETHDQLRVHLRDFVDAYNFARRLKTLRGLTPYEFVCKAWTSEPQEIQTQSAPANAGTKHLTQGRLESTLTGHSFWGMAARPASVAGSDVAHSSGSPALRRPSTSGGMFGEWVCSHLRVSWGLRRRASAKADVASSILPSSA